MNHVGATWTSATGWTANPEYVGRHRLGRNWLWVHDEPTDPTSGFKINLKGGAFHG